MRKIHRIEKRGQEDWGSSNLETPLHREPRKVYSCHCLAGYSHGDERSEWNTVVTLYTLPAHLKRGPHERNIRQYWSPRSTSQPHSGANARGVREYIFCPGMTGGADGSGQHLQMGASKAWKLRKQGWVSFPHGLDIPSTLYSLPIIHIQYLPHGRWGLREWELGSGLSLLQFSFTQAYTNTKTNASQKIQMISLH